MNVCVARGGGEGRSGEWGEGEGEGTKVHKMKSRYLYEKRIPIASTGHLGECDACSVAGSKTTEDLRDEMSSGYASHSPAPS